MALIQSQTPASIFRPGELLISTIQPNQKFVYLGIVPPSYPGSYRTMRQCVGYMEPDTAPYVNIMSYESGSIRGKSMYPCGHFAPMSTFLMYLGELIRRRAVAP